jgi:hypothetical protein
MMGDVISILARVPAKSSTPSRSSTALVLPRFLESFIGNGVVPPLHSNWCLMELRIIAKSWLPQNPAHDGVRAEPFRARMGIGQD